MNNKKFTLYKYCILTSTGFIGYMIIELLFRGYTYYTMGLAGSLAFILIGLINELIPWELYIEIQMVIASLIVTLIELIFGSILLNVFNMRMWDYSDQFLNYKGYICALFSFLWLFVGLFAIVLDDYIRYWRFNEERPHYKSFFVNIYKKIFKK